MIGAHSGRRALLRRAVGAVVALGVGGATAEQTAAKKKKCDKKAKRECAKDGLDCKNGKCVLVCNTRNSQCLDTSHAVLICGDLQDGCTCSALVEGGFACAARIDDPDQTCPDASECEQSSDCVAGEVCVNASQCCGSPNFGFCRRKCKI
ncbi:MAG: hypothetical protein U0031_17010 [Thermomicrobiales bacterium]